MSLATANAEYWAEYSNLQYVKHQLIHHYLNGWFPKMTLGGTVRRLLYMDTHAGRGKHLSGKQGSPLVALSTLLDHQARAQILQNTEVQFHFIERDKANHTALTEELSKIACPTKVQALPEWGDGFEIIERGINEAEGKGGSLPPSFIFVDPFGFRLPGKLLRRLMTYPRVELFVNVIWRELDMAIQQVRGASAKKPATQGHRQTRLFGEDEMTAPNTATESRESGAVHNLEPTLNAVFDGDGWRGINAQDSDARAEQCADLFRTLTKARWGTHIRMLDNGRIRYFLLHLTNHPEGRDLMKECMWKACPDGGFYASKADNPRQRLLVQPEPDLTLLRDWIMERLAPGALHWKTLAGLLREELWLSKHLNQTLREMRKAGQIAAQGVFGPTQNPLVTRQ